MRDIVSKIGQRPDLKAHDRTTPSNEDNKPDKPLPSPHQVDCELQLSLDRIEFPAYLVNSRFELEWTNSQAREHLLEMETSLSSDIMERNIFGFFLQSNIIRRAEGRDEMLRFHLSIAKNRLPKTSLLALVAESGDLENLIQLYDEVEAVHAKPLLHTEVNLAERGSEEDWYTVYASFFREGIFFAYAPLKGDDDSLPALLARRDIVIRDLLKKRRPYLTPLTILIADLQESVKICAELPPEEYFELINDLWGAMEPKLRKYYATHGKHVGDGMVYYFFPQPDCNYVLNAIRCAHEIKETMREINQTWRNRKGWMNTLQLNIGLHTGQEWFGTYQTPTHLEFTALGDTVNMAGRLSDFARSGSIWVTKQMIAQLTMKERSTIRFGIQRRGEDGSEILIPSTYSRISNLVDLGNLRFEKFRDIAVLPVTEILDVDME